MSLSIVGKGKLACYILKSTRDLYLSLIGPFTFPNKEVIFSFPHNFYYILIYIICYY